MRRSILCAFAGAGVAMAVIAMLAMGGCRAKRAGDDAPAAREEVPADVAAVTWDPAALLEAMPGLVGWRFTSAGEGALVAIAPEGGTSVVWAAPTDGAITYTPLAIDPDGPRVLCSATVEEDDGAGVESLVVLTADGTAEALPLPEGYEGVQDATLVDGRVLVAAYHATTETFVTALGSYSAAGAWEPVALEGELPDYHFVERLASVPGTDCVAVVLKTPGGTGDRDDEALVLCTLAGASLRSFTASFRDDALVGAVPLWDSKGVVYPRGLRIAGNAAVADLVRVAWTAEGWEERVLAQAAPFSGGIETGEVVAQDSSGIYWVRSADSGPHGTGAGLYRFDAAADSLVGPSVDLSDIEWFVWLERSMQ